MKYFISLIFFAILIAGSHQRKKCFAVITPEIVSELRQIILKAGLQESQLDKFVKVVRVVAQIAPDSDLSRFDEAIKAMVENFANLVIKVSAAGLDHLTPEIQQEIGSGIKNYGSTLSSSQIQQIVEISEIAIIESAPLKDETRIKEFLTDLAYLMKDIITKAM